MPQSRRILLPLSIVLALLMVAGAFWLSTPLVPTVNALSTDEALKAYAEKDSDADGLLDWREVLYGTDSTNPHSVTADLLDGEAVAQGRVKPRFASSESEDDMTALLEIYVTSQTVTDKFGQKFIQNFVKQRVDGPLTKEELTAFIESANDELLSRNTARYSTSDLTIGPRGKDAIQKYINDLDRVMAANSPTRDSRNVLEHYGDFVTKNSDVRSLIRIRAVGSAYSKSAEAMMTITVPPEVAAQHVDFANAYVLLGEVTTDMGAMDTDPLRGLIGFTQYEDVWTRVSDAFAAIGKTVSEQLDI